MDSTPIQSPFVIIKIFFSFKTLFGLESGSNASSESSRPSGRGNGPGGGPGGGYVKYFFF